METIARMSLLVMLIAAISFATAVPAAAASDVEKLAKIARKFAVPASTVFTPAFKPKAACYCRTDVDRRLGFLALDTPETKIYCAVPVGTSPEGQFLAVEFSCQDFEVLNK